MTAAGWPRADPEDELCVTNRSHISSCLDLFHRSKQSITSQQFNVHGCGLRATRRRHNKPTNLCPVYSKTSHTTPEMCVMIIMTYCNNPAQCATMSCHQLHRLIGCLLWMIEDLISQRKCDEQHYTFRIIIFNHVRLFSALHITMMLLSFNLVWFPLCSYIFYFFGHNFTFSSHLYNITWDICLHHILWINAY